MHSILQVMRRRWLLALVGPAAVLAVVLSPGLVSAGAFVEIDRGVISCGLDANDIYPGSPGFELANSTIVGTPGGTLVVTCFGSAPSDLSLAQTYQVDVICRGDTPEQDVTGHLTVTTSGQVSLMCRFPPNS
jgi:hypothetical protein